MKDMMHNIRLLCAGNVAGGVARRGEAGRGEAWRGPACRGLARPGEAWRALDAKTTAPIDKGSPYTEIAPHNMHCARKKYHPFLGKECEMYVG